MEKLAWAALFSWSVAISAFGQNSPNVDLSLQYSPLYVETGYTIWMNGVSGTAAHNFSDWFGFAGDLGVYRGHVPESITGETYMIGPRFSYQKFDRFIPFAQDLFVQALFGGSHFSESTGGITGGGTQFALAVGGGVDIGLGKTRTFALRPKIEYVGIRSGGSLTPATRLSIGVAYRFGQH
jgi:Outer membrane protein beta-barrel domain